MNRKSLLIVTLLIINHPVYAEQKTLTSQARSHTEKKSSPQKKSNFKENIVHHLVNRGLELSAAKVLVNENFKVSETFISQLSNILDDVSQEEIVKVLAREVLFRKEVKMTKQEDIIALTQSLGRFNLHEATREKLYRLVESYRENIHT